MRWDFRNRPAGNIGDAAARSGEQVHRAEQASFQQIALPRQGEFRREVTAEGAWRHRGSGAGFVGRDCGQVFQRIGDGAGKLWVICVGQPEGKALLQPFFAEQRQAAEVGDSKWIARVRTGRPTHSPFHHFAEQRRGSNDLDRRGRPTD
jgi:hypothetical protein